MKRKLSLWLILALLASLLLGGCVEADLVDEPETQTFQTVEAQLPAEAEDSPEIPPETEPELLISEDGEFTSKEEVAAYIYLYGHLPSNYITKKEAQNLGWVNKDGNLWKVAPGKSIGGDYFGNYEGLLPEAKGRKYTECDIDFEGKYRNAKRIIFSNDGLIYYTEDHYETFELLYGEE